MATEKEKIFSSKKALTEDDLRKFCNANNFSFNIIEFDKLSNYNGPRYSFIFTGTDKNTVNKGHDHHWLFLDSLSIFDSYGNPKSYNIPSPYYMIRNNPKQLQEYDSTVCGEYCCAWYYFLKNILTDEMEEDEMGEEFSDYFGFTNDKFANDKIVYDWYHNEDFKKNPKSNND
jgi:hypothetical protein